MNTAIFTTYEPDPIGQILGTGFCRFETPFGISGLAKAETVERLELLAVVASRPNTGQLRRFIDQAKKHFSEICIWHDWNPIIGEAMERYGFQRAEQREPNGELLTGWKWRRE